jgi:P pilus assembly chaperone PapD
VSRFTTICAAAVAVALGFGAAPALAAGFQIAPTRVMLDEANRGGVVQIANQRADDVRFRVSVHAWSQRDDGEMVLTETDDLRVYPRHLEVQGHNRAMVRVLASPRFEGQERAYRIVVEEVAQGRTSAATPLRMRIAVPVFLASTAPRHGARIGELRVGLAGEVSFALANTGSVHVRPRAVEVIGYDESGREIARQVEDGWYVLPGGRLRYDVSLDRSACEVRRVEVRVLGAGGPAVSRTAAAPRCPAS